MTTGQIVSIVFLVVMVVLILRGIRRHRRKTELMELDATGRQIALGTERMVGRLETETMSSSEGAGGGD